MGRLVMDRGFRRIKKAPVAAEPVDPRLALVDLFVNGQAAPQGFVDLSSGPDSPHYSDLFIEDAQEPAEEPVADETENLAVEAPEAADEALAQPEPEEKTEDPEPVAAEDDYDPIAAVLG
jgi:hypothetical protein